MTCRKKIVCLVMAIIAVFTCLCGCGKQGASAEENKEPQWVFPSLNTEFQTIL